MSAKLLIDIPTLNWAYTIPLQKEKSYRFGTLRGIEVTLPVGTASELHALVRFADAWTIEDCGSTTGTFVNGQVISAHRLRDQDILKVGNCEAVYQNPKEAVEADEWSHTHRVAQGHQTALAEVVQHAGSGKVQLQQLEQALGVAPSPSSTPPPESQDSTTDLVWVAQKLAEITSVVLLHPGTREQTYKLMLQKLREAISADNGFVMIPEPENMRWIIRAWVGDSDSWTQYERSHPLPLTVTNRAYRTNIVVSNALAGSGAGSAGEDEPINSLSMQQLNVNSYIAVPLVEGNQRRGVLYFDTRTPDRKFQPRHVKLLELVGNFILEIEDQRN